MERKIAGLFDLDGVILDTEDFYSQFWGEQGRLYCPEIPDFTAKVKGRTLSDLLTTYFPGKEQAETIIRKLGDFERQMPFRFIAGADGFIRDLKAHGVKLAIVTSSNDAKMAEVYRVLPQLKEWFDVMSQPIKSPGQTRPGMLFAGSGRIAIHFRPVYCF